MKVLALDVGAGTEDVLLYDTTIIHAEKTLKYAISSTPLRSNFIIGN